MECCGTVNYSAKAKEEPNDMCYNESYDGETVNQDDIKNLQCLGCVQENTIYTIEKQRGAEEFRLNQEMKIEFECKDMKPDFNLLVPDKGNEGTHQFQPNQKIKMKTESVVNKEKLLDDTLETIDTDTSDNDDGWYKKILHRSIKLSTECETCLKIFSSKRVLQIHVESVHKRITYPCGESFAYRA